MKKNDIKAGVVYGYATGTSEFRVAVPLIVLDTASLWTWTRQNRSDRTTWKVSGQTRYSNAYDSWSSRFGAHGHLALIGARYVDPEEAAQTLAVLQELYTEFAATAGNPDAVNALAEKVSEMNGVRLEVVNNRWIQGDYTEAKNAEAERDAARQAEYKAKAARAAAEAAFIDEVSAVLSAKLERTVTVGRDYSWDSRNVSIRFDDLAAFLGIKTPAERL